MEVNAKPRKTVLGNLIKLAFKKRKVHKSSLILYPYLYQTVGRLFFFYFKTVFQA